MGPAEEFLRALVLLGVLPRALEAGDLEAVGFACSVVMGPMDPVVPTARAQAQRVQKDPVAVTAIAQAAEEVEVFLVVDAAISAVSNRR